MQALEQGRGAVAFQGKMIDLPVALRAEALLRNAAMIAAREQA